MKRAARHFGERLGNALYVKGNGIRTAPKTNEEEALEMLERSDQLNLFGDQVLLRDRCKTEELQHVVGNATLPGMNQPPTPIVSSAARPAKTYNPVAVMPRQSTGSNTVTSAPTNHYTSYKPTAAAPTLQTNHSSVTSIHQDKYTSNSRTSALSTAAVPQNQVQTTTMQRVNQNTTTTNVYNPQEVRGISPETTNGFISDASKRGLPAVAVRNSLGNNSVPVEDSNKRQKMNPYATNRLSC